MERTTRQPHSNHPPGPRRRAHIASIAVAIIGACIALLPAVHQASASSGAVALEVEDPSPLRDSKRWWLNTWCHSMQETCFVLWMDDTTGTTAWRWTMNPRQVNALYLWWSVSVWDGAGGP